jgi:hypothetical protein
MTKARNIAALVLASLAFAPVAQAQQQPNYGGYTTAIKGGTSTGRPGEVVWYLIINTARPECPTYIAIRGGRDVY